MHRAKDGSRFSQFENKYFTEMYSGSEAGSYSRLVDFVYHSTPGLRVIKQNKKGSCCRISEESAGEVLHGFHGYRF